tara:strand:- start:80 stop:184 length:105 start_codon:yes stop_codon:yes gene_type:complete
MFILTIAIVAMAIGALSGETEDKNQLIQATIRRK